ncbi:uncharacterized protein BDZ99DRAFT_469556 [Mytilinidion resinicola]|uniref:Uncharacterized protein n=1 Tax=Mytilinidion resinicola TaxID=574789 RepID=A0A6A6XYC1_9PEZI|nr:uncharacterized protein BDZ99DRAFT_469556 [Mytilinidion resinicola]KAF2801551.1 hypothetical protein BDZ99DRAFT_469556 [Mytilinidion resinicola]
MHSGELSVSRRHSGSPETLYEKLCTKNCEECGDFGGYPYLITCKRLCFTCFSEDNRYLPMRLSHAIKRFGSKIRDLGTLPYMRSVPGMYTPPDDKVPLEEKVLEELTLVDYESAYRVGTRAMQKKDDVMMAQPVGSRRKRRPIYPVDLDPYNPLHYTAVVRQPWFDIASGKVVHGFRCIGCRDFYGYRPVNHRRKFTRQSFIEHLRQCGNILNGEHCQDESCKGCENIDSHGSSTRQGTIEKTGDIQALNDIAHMRDEAPGQPPGNPISKFYCQWRHCHFQKCKQRRNDRWWIG